MNGDLSDNATGDVREVKQTTQGRDWRPKSTLHLRPRDSLSFLERIAAQGLMPDEYHELKPANLDRGPIPKQSVLKDHVWILSHALPVVLLQQLSFIIFPQFRWPIYLAAPLYILALKQFLTACVQRCDWYSQRWGTFDEKVIGRDRLPDDSVNDLAKGFIAFLVLRTAGEFTLKWNSAEQPIHAFSWSTPARMFLWQVVLDLFFYTYHRACHENDFLWSIHKRHHATKHPSPALAILADNFQEVIEIALCPLAATLLVPLTFHELFLMVCYTVHSEILGHTGIRADWGAPITGPVLQLFGCELIIEDHDLHHRYGKSGKNYGKQTRLWDVLFGTCGVREETRGLPGHRRET